MTDRPEASLGRRLDVQFRFTAAVGGRRDSDGHRAVPGPVALAGRRGRRPAAGGGAAESGGERSEAASQTVPRIQAT